MWKLHTSLVLCRPKQQVRQGAATKLFPSLVPAGSTSSMTQMQKVSNRQCKQSILPRSAQIAVARTVLVYTRMTL